MKVIIALLLILAQFSLGVQFPKSARSEGVDKWKCTNGRDPSTLNATAYLTEFAKSPCKPFLFVPAMTSGRMVADFLCSEAQTNYQNIWNTCGWIIPCSTKSIQFYPPSATWAATFALNIEQFEQCLFKIFTPVVTMKNGKPEYYEKPGMKIRPQWEGAYNFGVYVERKNSCGFRANNKILNGPGFIEKLQAKYFADFWDDMEWLGYRANISIFNFAYDWRMDAGTAVRSSNFRAMAEQLYELTGKKVVVAGHSYGVPVGYEGLTTIPKTRRMQIIDSFSSFGGPWLGAYMPYDYIMGEMMVADIAGHKIPQNLYSDMMTNLGVLYTLTPKNVAQRFSNADWIKNGQKLADYYSGKTQTKPFDWMPTREELCDKDTRQIADTEMYQGRALPGVRIWSGCNWGAENLINITKVGDKQYTLNDIPELYRQYSPNKMSATYFPHWNTHVSAAFDNLGIRVNFVAQNNVSTTGDTHYKGIKNGRFDLEGLKKTAIHGDGTVPFTSQLGPAFKWAGEFKSSDKNTAPIKIIHYCNKLSSRSTNKYVERSDWDQEFWSNKNSYLGHPCSCGNEDFFQKSLLGAPNPQMGSVCNHVGGFNDDFIHGFMGRILTADPNVKRGNLTKFASDAGAKYLDDMAGHCMLEKPYFLANWRRNHANHDTSLLRRNDASWRRLLKPKAAAKKRRVLQNKKARLTL